MRSETKISHERPNEVQVLVSSNDERKQRTHNQFNADYNLVDCSETSLVLKDTPEDAR